MYKNIPILRKYTLNCVGVKSQKVVGWPKTLFEFSHMMEQKARMNFLASPIYNLPLNGSEKKIDR